MPKTATVICLCLAALPAIGGSAEEPNKVPLVERPLPPSALHQIGGYIGRRINAGTSGYLKPFDIDGHVRMVEQPRHRAWWWIGEQPGKWLESAALTGCISGDADLEKKGRAMLARLAAAQEPSGYLGITDPAVRTPQKPLRGMDPYELYFTLHGLLTAHEVWGDPKALDAARKLGDYFVSTIGPGKAEFWPSSYRSPQNVNTIICEQFAWVPPNTPSAPQLEKHSEIAGHTAHYGWEGTLLIDPMLRLHQATGDAKYLEWGRWVVQNIDRWSGWNSFSNLDKVADGTMGMHQMQPYVHSHTFQMNALGFLRLYRITGDESYLRKVRGLWKDVAERQMYITGGVSVAEHYEPGYRRPVSGHVVETCANMSWMQLTQDLLTLSGEPAYADAIERLLFNHVFASQTIDGDCYRYHTPPNGFKPDDYFHGPDCCTSSGHRIVSMLPLFLYAQGPAGIYVNQFVSSTASFRLDAGTVKLRQETNYPETDTIVLNVEPEQPAEFALQVRIPGWCATPAADVNGQAVAGVKPGAYAVLRRTWRAGDRVTLRFPMKATWIEHDHFEGPLPPPRALMRGPVVYALDTVWWDDTKAPMPFDVGREVAVDRKDAEVQEASAPEGLLGPALAATIRLSSNEALRVRFLPFTNIGKWYRDGVPKPDRKSRAFSYAVWLQDAESPAFASAAKEAQRIGELARTSVDYILIGDAKSERVHKLKGESQTGPFNGRTYRHARGWFSWELKVQTEQPTELAVTYWGGELERRVFDIFVNDVKVATQALDRDKPGEFFEARYAIPFELIQGKTNSLGQKVDSVTVMFQAQGGSTAGGVFGIRTVAKTADDAPKTR